MAEDKTVWPDDDPVAPDFDDYEYTQGVWLDASTRGA